MNQTEKSSADMHLLYMPAFLRGLKGVYFYCWHQAWTQNHRGFWLCGPDGVLTPQGRGAAQVAKAAQTLAPVLMTGRVPPATAAVYFPWEEISQTPNVAPISAMRGAYKLMTQLHYPTDIISHHNIAAGELTRYRVLLLPLSRHLRPETAQRIAEFVRAGGILIAEYQAGRFDQFHRETDSLRGLLGGKSLGTTDAFKSFDAGDDKGIRLYAPITKETPFGWRHRPNVEPIDRAERIAAAADAGAQALTHLGNGVPGMVPRHRNPIWAGLAEERLSAMIITDGHHLPPELIRVICKVKGAAKIIVTSDASPGAGLPPGPCRVFGSDAILEPGGRLYNPATGYLAGSAVMLAECMRRLESLGIFSEAELRMAGRDNALKLIGPA